MATKTCSKCGIEKSVAEFDKDSYRKGGLRSWCKSCAADYRATHKAERAAYKAEYDAAHKAEKAEYDADYRATHKAERAAYKAEYDAAHKAERAEYDAEWRKAHPDYNAEWRKTNPDKRKASDHKRRARKRDAGGSYTGADELKLYERQQAKCAYCGCDISHDGAGYHIEHVIPLSRGGSNHPYNIVLACPSCNLRKGDKTPSEFGYTTGKLRGIEQRFLLKHKLKPRGK